MPDRIDQIEVNLFGPGFGECAVIHVGENNWIIIDSCVSGREHNPAALAYLESEGVDASVAVRCVIASHWHDDHVKGLSKVVKHCISADFCLSGAQTEENLSLL